MKKILTMLMIFGAINLFGVDLSIDTSNTEQSSSDTTTTSKKSKDIKESESNKESTSYTKDTSKSKSKEAVRLAQTDILNFIGELELNNVYPFSSCKIINAPKLPSDFNITSEDKEYNIIDVNLATLLDKAASNNSFVDSVITFKEVEFYDYVNCINFYGAIIAQSLKTSELKGEIEDEEIKELYLKTQKALQRAFENQKFKTKFHKSLDTLTINSLKVKLDYEPILMFNQITLYGQNYFGYTANSRKSISLTEAKKDDKTSSKDNSINLSRTKDVAYLNKSADNLDYSFKTNFSIRNYLPK